MATIQKLEPFTTSSVITYITIQKLNEEIINDFVIEFETKNLEEVLQESLNPYKNIKQIIVTLWGGGSSGIKGGDSLSTFATGGYSSGIILRFPIELNTENKFAIIHVGKGGSSFEMKSTSVISNGEYSMFQLMYSEYPNGFMSHKYRNVETSENKTKEIERLISYGGGIISGSENIIESNSTDLFYSFNGSNKNNTSEPKDDLEEYDHRNFYCPYTSKYNGYNSFIGKGGRYDGILDADEHSGAGGSGYLSNVTKEYDKKGNLLPARVGKGGNGGCILEYENTLKLKVYAVGYIYISPLDTLLTLQINDDIKAYHETIEVTFESKTYSISKFLGIIKSFLPENSEVTINDFKIKITLRYRWSIDITKSSKSLLTQLGFNSNDNKKWEEELLKYEIQFSLPMYDLCDVNKITLL